MNTNRETLHVTAFQARTLSWWRTQKLKIDMNPPYQRRGQLWSDADKAFLIDSILNGFDIPKLYLADFTYSDSRLNKKFLPYAIIDGKQRFEAIFDFFEGKITLHPDIVLLEKPTLKVGGLGYRDLVQNHSQLAEMFDNYNLSVMSIITDSTKLINELFVRLNRSKPLTGSEIRNAMGGRAPEVIRQLATHDFFRESITFQVKRGQDLNAAAKFLLFEFSNKLQETKKSNLDMFIKTAGKDKARLELSGRRVLATLDDMMTIFLPHDRLLGSAGVVPVYYWFLRSIKERRRAPLRDFLVRFEEQRKENRKKAASGTGKIDRELVEYDRFNRSTNDLVSHQGRLAILQRRFGKKAKAKA